MLKLCLFVSLLAGSALANGGRRGGRRWWDDKVKLDEVSPPHCTCTRDEKDGRNSSMHDDKWIARWLKPNETVAEFKAKMEKNMMVCGTDGVTYADKCQFINNASANPGLGKRCRGPCPCNFTDEMLLMATQKEDQPDESMDSPPICLNNGTTVSGRKELFDALLSNASIGKRCMGECSECATELKCPRRHMDRRHHHHHRESNVTAPDCTCTLSTKPWVQKFLNSTCGKKFLAKRQICGSDNVTYANKCEFKNNQTTNAALGKRCHGACPCDFKKEEESNHSRFGQRDFKSHHADRFDFHRSPKPICLNNGVTVFGWKESREAIKANASLGVRCKGECSECQSAPIKCPVDWVKIKEEEEASRPKPPNCTCPKGLEMGFGNRHRGHQICGNDNKTYANICELVNNQSSQPTLGFRCLGECPCKNHSEKVDDASKLASGEPDHEEPEESDHAPPGTGPEGDHLDAVDEHHSNNNANLQSEGDMEEEGDAEVSENTREKRNAGWEFGRHHRHHGRHRRHHHRRHRSVCLTNGQTVKGWRNISEAFQADPTVGIRCRGHCEWCANATHCPWFPSEEKQKEMKEKVREMMQEKGRRFMEMTVESSQKPGQCDCTFGFPKKNESESRMGGHRGWGRHHGERRHHKMDWNVCGTNNVTYKTMCELTNNQSIDKNLGFRCHGECPCPIDFANLDEDFEEDNRTESQVFKKYIEDHGGKFAFCLTNGTTVYTKRELRAALASDKSLGTRYMNECSVGDAGLKCPRVFRPFNETGRFKHGKGFMGKKFNRRHGEEGKMAGWKGKEGKFGRRHEMEANETEGRFDDWQRDNRTEEQRHQDWQMKKHSPSVEFRKAFDFGFEMPFGGRHHHRRHHHHHRRHHGGGEGSGRRMHGGEDWCTEDDQADNQGNSTLVE